MKTQSAIRASFWESMPRHIRPQFIPCGRSGKTGRLVYRRRTQNEYPASVRTAFVDYVDSLEKSGTISARLAESVTL